MLYRVDIDENWRLYLQSVAIRNKFISLGFFLISPDDEASIIFIDKDGIMIGTYSIADDMGRYGLENHSGQLYFIKGFKANAFRIEPPRVYNKAGMFLGRMKKGSTTILPVSCKYCNGTKQMPLFNFYTECTEC